MNFVLLDGQQALPKDINPARHRFLGSFRPPVNPFDGATCDCLCPCGKILRYVEESRQHYMQGCFDVLQYVSIEAI